MADKIYQSGLDTLVTHIHEILLQQAAGMREYDLMEALDQRCVEGFGQAAFADQLSMFQSHFILFHCLYVLRDRLHQSGEAGLDIHCLSIKLTPYKNETSGLLQKHDPLRDYYLDLKNLDKTDAEEVDRLMNSFGNALSPWMIGSWRLNSLVLPIRWNMVRSNPTIAG